jgi:hypothetical protein
MSTYTCAQLHEVAPELALAVLGGSDRAEALIHLTECSRCQTYVAELTEAADIVPFLAPEREPPPGFEQRVVARLGAGRRRRFRRLAAVAAIAAAAAAILSITIVRVIDATSPVVPDSATATMVQARMVSDATGTSAGWAYVSDQRSVALAVDYGVDTGTYGVSVTPASGKAVVIGDMTIADQRGSWTGTSSVDLGRGSEIALVDDRGAQVCHGMVEATR